MQRLLVKARTRVGVAVIGAAMLAGAGSATAAVLVQPASTSTPDGGQVFEAPAAEPTEPTEAPVPVAATPEAVEVAAPAPDTSAATVDAVTEPEPATAAAPDPAPVAEPAPETIPAPQVNPDGSLPEGWLPPLNPGEPPIAPDPGPAPVEPLPGEPGYTG